MAEHTLAENLIRLNQAKEDIADAIVAKGGSASHLDGLESMPDAIAAIPSTATVDQTYDPTSANAQSGVAIEGKKPGLKTTGTEYTIDGNKVVAGDGAEVFNDYTNNKASGNYSHAEGNNTTASGNSGSHAEGYYTKATGNYGSHAEGRNTAASGPISHAEGYYTTASGQASHAEGYYTTAKSQYQHVQGTWNVEDSSNTYAFIIGNGTFINRHNAFAVDWNGLIYVNGATTGVDVAALAATIGDINSVLEEVL